MFRPQRFFTAYYCIFQDFSANLLHILMFFQRIPACIYLGFFSAYFRQPQELWKQEKDYLGKKRDKKFYKFTQVMKFFGLWKKISPEVQIQTRFRFNQIQFRSSSEFRFRSEKIGSGFLIFQKTWIWFIGFPRWGLKLEGLKLLFQEVILRADERKKLVI